MNRYLNNNVNRRYEICVVGESCAYRFIGRRYDYLEKPINLRDICYYAEPLIIYDRIGHDFFNARVVFPPFRDYTVIKEGDLSDYSEYTFTSGGVVDLFEYILDNYCDVSDFGFRNVHRILSIIRKSGWEWTSTIHGHGDQFTDVETGKVVFGFMNVIEEIERENMMNNMDFEYDEYYDD